MVCPVALFVAHLYDLARFCSTGSGTRQHKTSFPRPALARARCSPATGRGSGHSLVVDVGLDEREKELIRMKMERLDAAKTILDREHALHSGTAGPPSTSGGGGAGTAGGR